MSEFKKSFDPDRLFTLNEPFGSAWVAALRSKRYKQGKGHLCKNDEYCCLGVGEEVLIAQGVDIVKAYDPDYKAFTYDIEAKLPGPYHAIQYMGFPAHNGLMIYMPAIFADKDYYEWKAYALYTMNDDWELTFDQIADLVEYFCLERAK